MPVTLALYPIFFAMSVQWGAFNGAQGFNSSTIFSTNNTKQTSLALAHYLCEKDPMYLAKCWFYAATLLCFHLGATLSFFAVKLWGLRASWCVIPLAAWAYYMVCCEEKSEQRTPPSCASARSRARRSRSCTKPRTSSSKKKRSNSPKHKTHPADIVRRMCFYLKGLAEFAARKPRKK